MEREEAQLHLNNQVSLLLSNGFMFNGEVIDVTADTLVIIDRYSKRVSIRLKDIFICTSEVIHGNS